MENWRNDNHSKRHFNSSKVDNWRVRAPQMENKRNLNRPNERLTSFYSLNYLIEIKNQNSDVIILRLIEQLEKFAQFLESTLRDDWIVLTVAILAKVCSSCFRHNKLAILKTVAETTFLQKLDNYVRILHGQDRAEPEKNKYFWKNVEEFFVNLLFVCDSFTDVTSNKACEMLPKLLEAIDMTVLYLEEQQNIEIGQNTKQNITILKKKLNLCEQRSTEDKSGDSSLDDFRKWNVAMTGKDILNSNDIVASNYFVEGRYDNVQHYLDVQFRLLKEYFVAPYRENITNCIEHINIIDMICNIIDISILKRLSEYRHYPDVIFHSIVFDKFEIKIIIKFSDQETIKEIFCKKSNNYFRSNTLVFLTKDNFLSVLIGHVIERDVKQQHLVIRFEPEHTNYDPNGSYTIVGTKTFYQPYCYALKALQCTSEVDFPMKKYFVDVDPRMESPGYLNSSSVYNIQGKPVDLFGNNWPSAEQLRMDSSQYSAFKAALTQKFNLIQGFPGTGKTHLGLEIVKTLLHVNNRKIWYNGTPILIVTSSVQALDTFLEGLMSTTREMIRVGENVTNGLIEEFLLRFGRKENRTYYTIVATWKRKLAKLSEQIEKWIRHLIQIKKFDDIINFTLLATIDENIKTSWFSQASNADLNAWLFDGEEIQNADPQSIEMSEIINYVTEEEKNFDCEGDVTAFPEAGAISADPERIILLSKSHLWVKIVGITKVLQNLKTQINQTDNAKKLEARLIQLWQIYQFFQVRISDQVLSQPPVKPTNVDYDSPHDMDSIDRWNLYFYWLNLYIRYVEKKIVELQYEHRELTENFTEIRNIVDLGIMKRTLVLGMTIHVAHRLQTTLQALKCRIMVVEEASQMLESQLVISLTKHCENLILFGDHYKLGPNIAEDNINELKNSTINVMERMVNNKMQLHVLGVQHRMSAKISKLFVPHFYPEFDSYHLDAQCPAILGIPSCMFFIDHEPQGIDESSTEEYYLYEAKFLISLACYMRKIGYKPEDITILASYYNQMVYLYIRSRKYEHLLKDVRIDHVVNYHGQESKVILLSMALHNQDRKLGYLENESSIIFALSRAKECLFMMGNINLFCENSESWPKFKKVLVEQNCLGNYFPVCCQRNPNHITQIKKPEDFDKISNEVCSEICGTTLNCGHRCLKSCHILDCDRIGSTTGTEICLE